MMTGCSILWRLPNKSEINRKQVGDLIGDSGEITGFVFRINAPNKSALYSERPIPRFVSRNGSRNAQGGYRARIESY